MLRLSQGTADAILTDLKARFINCTAHVYSTSQPTKGSDAETGVLLARITLDSSAFIAGQPGNGLNFDVIDYDDITGIITLHKDLTENWSGIGLANGTPGYVRIYDNSLTTGEDITAIRIDGTAALQGGEFALSSASVKEGVPITMDSCDIKLPLYKR